MEGLNKGALGFQLGWTDTPTASMDLGRNASYAAPESSLLAPEAGREFVIVGKSSDQSTQADFLRREFAGPAELIELGSEYPYPTTRDQGEQI